MPWSNYSRGVICPTEAYGGFRSLQELSHRRGCHDSHVYLSSDEFLLPVGGATLLNHVHLPVGLWILIVFYPMYGLYGTREVCAWGRLLWLLLLRRRWRHERRLSVLLWYRHRRRLSRCWAVPFESYHIVSAIWSNSLQFPRV